MFFYILIALKVLLLELLGVAGMTGILFVYWKVMTRK